MFGGGWKLAFLILVMAALLRLWGTFDLNEYIEDESLHIATVKSLVAYSTTMDSSWHHPQLSSMILSVTMRIFGDNAVGWRSGNVFFSVASVLLMFLIGRLLYPGTAVPLIAMALLAMDPHHIYISRTTFVEIPVSFFFLLYLYLVLEYTENRRQTLLFAGLAMGLTMATKAYFAFAIPIVGLFALHRARQRGELTGPLLKEFAAALVLLPFAVYFLTYLWWFGRGYTLFEFIQMKLDALWALRQISIDNFVHHRAFLEAGGTPLQWFVKPMLCGHQRLIDSERALFLIQSNNPPFRLLVLPSLCVALFHAWKRHSVHYLLAPLLFCCCYLLVLAARRPVFSYSVIPLLPFAYFMLAHTVTLLARKLHRELPVYVCFTATMIIWVAYMFPILSARLVPIAFFRPILSMASFLGNF